MKYKYIVDTRKSHKDSENVLLNHSKYFNQYGKPENVFFNLGEKQKERNIFKI